jgi:hypothetical protein
MLAKATPNVCRFRCITLGFDNRLRRSRDPVVIIDATPAKYGAWLKRTIAMTRQA